MALTSDRHRKTTTANKQFLILTVMVCSIWTCVEPISFEADDEVGILVVDGILPANGDTSTIRLLRTDILGKRVFPEVRGATISIRDDIGQYEIYEEIESGHFVLPGKFVTPEVGRIYQLEIILADGTTYHSRPEKIPVAPEIDSLTFNVSIEQQIVDETRELERRFFNLFAQGRISLAPEQTFLRWDVEHVFAVSEITCGPLHTPKTCYVKPPINPNLLFLLDGSKLNEGAIFKEQLTRQPMDFAFGQTASFYVSQKAINRAAFQYWNNVDKIVNDIGTIFDAPPAGIPGNMFNVADPGELVLGYFTVYDERKKLALIRAADLGEYAELPFCGIAGFPPDPLPDACCSCTSFEHSSTIRPSYWP